MRILLLAASQDASAEHLLAQLYPGASLEVIGKAALADPTPWKALRRLRQRRPGVFAVVWERLDWPLQQALYACYGTLLGAREVVFLDDRGQVLRQTWTAIWLREAPRAALEFLLAPALIGLTWLAVAYWSLQRPRKTPSKPRNASWLFLRTTPTPATLAGGAATHIRGFVSALARQQHPLHVLTNDPIPDLPPAIPQTVIAPSSRFALARPLSGIWNAWRFGVQAYAAVKKSQPGCIYQRYSRFNFSGAWLARRLGVPFLLEYNGSEVWVARYWDRIGLLWLLERIEQVNLRMADLIFTVSAALQRELSARGIAPERVVVNPNGVDSEQFRPDCGGRALRAQQGWAAEDVVVGFLGTFGPWHGAELLAEAIVHLPREPRLRFLLIGRGNQLPEVQRRVQGSAWADRAVFVGRILHPDVPQWLDACDILVSPHVPMPDGREFFGSPTKLFEYMAMGKAIVASRLGQIGEILAHEHTALLVEPGDAAALGAAIVRLARDAALRARLGAAARQEVSSKFTWQQNAARVLEAYQRRFGSAPAMP